MEKINTKIFEDLGFTKNEIKIYFHLLKFGESTTGPIIKETKISASKAYINLDKLISKGLVSFIIKKKTKYFQANLPEKLLEYIEEKEKIINNRKNKIKKIIPELKKLNKARNKEENAQMFIGTEGLKSIFNIILENLKEGEEYYSFSQGEVENKELSLFYIKHHQKRILKKIKVKLIADPQVKDTVKKLPIKYLSVKYIKDPFPLGTIIFKDYVINYTVDSNPVGYLIKSEKISKTYKLFFEDVWKRN
jgi:HTH-type transcriptional regulator, sugar sensing transcriptional regulator